MVAPRSSRNRAVLELPFPLHLYANVKQKSFLVRVEKYLVWSITAEIASNRQNNTENRKISRLYFFDKEVRIIESASILIPEHWSPNTFLSLVAREILVSGIISVSLELAFPNSDDIFKIRQQYYEKSREEVDAIINQTLFVGASILGGMIN